MVAANVASTKARLRTDVAIWITSPDNFARAELSRAIKIPGWLYESGDNQEIDMCRKFIQYEKEGRIGHAEKSGNRKRKAIRAARRV